MLETFTDVLGDLDEIDDSQPLSLSSVEDYERRSAVDTVVSNKCGNYELNSNATRPSRGTGQYGEFRSVEEIDAKYRGVFSYPFFNLVQSRVIDDALYSDKSMVVCAPTGSGKTVLFEMAIVHLLMELEENENHDFKIIYMAPVKALCTERLTEWHSKFTKLGLMCIEVTGDTDVDFSQLKPYRIIITTPEKWDMLTRRWHDHRQLVEVIKLFLIDEVHILNDETRGPVLEAVVSRMKTIETSVQSTHRIEQLQQQYQGTETRVGVAPSIRFIAVSATVGNPEDVAAWLGTSDKPAVYYKFGDECRPVKLKRVVEGYPCAEGTSIFKFDLVLNYKLWPIIQKYHDGKPTLIFCNTRKSVALTAETLSREITITFNEEQKARLTALASTIKNKKLQTLVLSGVGCHHAGLLYEERTNIEHAFRNRDLPILITTTTLAMGVNLPAHLVIIKNTQQYVSGAYQEYSISTVLQMVGRAGRPQFDTEATAVIMTRLADKPRYQALVGGSEPLQSYLHKRLPENLNSEAALGTVGDVAQCVQWLNSTFLSVRAAKDPKRYLGLPRTAPPHQISKKIEELCVKAMNGLASSGLITMDEACCIESTEAGRLMSIYYLDLETMKHIMKIDGSETLERLLWIVCESHELADMHLRQDERRCLNTLNRNNAASTIRFPMKGKITTRQMKLNCVIQAILGCLSIPDPSLNQEATKIMRIAERICKCLVSYVTRQALVTQQPKFYSAVLNTITLAKCVAANLWENSPFVSKQLKGIGPTFSTLLATAGKVNFMLLEESHPRDLERIMNKGPPAGNILRKQVSLFPKYQLTMTPVDEKVVSIQLILLNHHNLSENIESLTAGPMHKSYIIVGDSENILLLLTSFTDKDLIGVYDGNITYQITRKHGFEHKIYAHCVSTAIAGIDARSEYVFKDIEPKMYPPQSNLNDDLVKNTTKKQTTITDTFRERKRKSSDSDITQSKEKKKRESAILEKFKYLKESFGKTSKVLKADLEKTTVMSAKILQDLTHSEQPNTQSLHSYNDTPDQTYKNNEEPVKSSFFEVSNTYEINDDDFINDEFMDDDKINNILIEIESEISKGSSTSECLDKAKRYSSNENATMQKAIVPKSINVPSRISYSHNENYKSNNNTKRVNKNISKKSNYNFIDLLEKNIDLSDEEETKEKDQNSFSDTIRTHIEKYLQKTKSNVKLPDRLLKNLIQDEPVPGKETEPIIIVQDSVTNKNDDNSTLTKTVKSNTENIMITDLHDEPTINETTKQVSVLEEKIKSIDLTLDAFLTINGQDRELYDDQELPAIEIRKNNETEGMDNKKTAELESENFVENNIMYDDIDFTNITEPENEPKTEHYYTDKTDVTDQSSDEPDLKKPKLDLRSDADTFIQFVEPHQKFHNWENNILANTEQKHGIIEASKFEEPIKIDVQPRNKENNKEITENINLIPIFHDNIKATLQNHDRDSNTLVRSVPQGEKKQEALKLWKTYIKELPIELDKNNRNTTTYINSCEPDNQKASTQKEDNRKILQYDLLKNIYQIPGKERIKRLCAIEPHKNIKGIFTPPYKYGKTITRSLKPQQIFNNKPTALLEERRNQESDEIKPQENNMDTKEISNYGAPSSVGNQIGCIQQNFSFATSSYSNQLNPTDIFNKLPSNATSDVTEIIKEDQLPDTILKKTNVFQEINNKVSNYNNPSMLSSDFINSKVSTEYNYGKKSLIYSSKVQELLEHPRHLEMKLPTEYNTDITYNNLAPCVTGDQPVYSQRNSQNNYINKYSFTSNKIDVATQETADHVVRVIRKLRIDLDVTEFISEKTVKNNDQGSNVQEENEYQNKSKTVVEKNLNPTAHVPSIECIDNNSAISASYETKLDEEAHTETISPNIGPASQLLGNDKKDTKNENIINEELIDKINKDAELFDKYKKQDTVKEIKPNNVQSILQKYSNVMRNRCNADMTLTQMNANEKCSKVVNKDKPKRPFKISDIEHLNATPLADTLLENTTEQKAVNVTECFNLLQPNDKHIQLEQNNKLNLCDLIPMPEEPVVQQYKETQEAPDQITPDENVDVPDCDIDITYMEDLEEKDLLSNIDQTMFNPKTLLQCFSKDESENYISPPPEFRDLNTSLDNTAAITLSSDCYEPMAWEENNDITSEGFHYAEMTPPKEVETWNLPQDEGDCKLYASPRSSPFSFTITRKNKETAAKNVVDKRLLQNATLPRHIKLKQFKFNHRNKLNL